ncbi:hypothetical protein [Virgibacillus siamensis]|uniref:hypothetical protein n=1 Tax=Virgibacillus siamensis TaxID=480071 RepID=UPI0009857705|nr:hypothetical protein [Virgibacillus siamensis]
MKTLLVTTAAGAMILTAGGFAGTGVFDPDEAEQSDAEAGTNHMKQQEIKADIKMLPEFEVLEEQVNLRSFSAEVVENNQHERIILFKSDSGQAQYKSIFVKNTNRLKMIAFDQGMIFNTILPEVDVHQEDTEDNDGNREFPEFTVLDEHIDADDYEMQIVKDNAHKRVIILNNDNGDGQFKSIYMKDTNVLKIIDFKQGMVFKGTIG